MAFGPESWPLFLMGLFYTIFVLVTTVLAFVAVNSLNEYGLAVFPDEDYTEAYEEAVKYARAAAGLSIIAMFIAVILLGFALLRFWNSKFFKRNTFLMTLIIIFMILWLFVIGAMFTLANQNITKLIEDDPNEDRVKFELEVAQQNIRYGAVISYVIGSFLLVLALVNGALKFWGDEEKKEEVVEESA